MVSFSLRDILAWTSGRWVNTSDLEVSSESFLDERQVTGIASLGQSTPHDLAFYYSRAFEQELHSAHPGILLVREKLIPALREKNLPFWKTTPILVCPNPDLALAISSEKFAMQMSSVAHGAAPLSESWIHPTATVDPSAQLGEGVQVGAYCVIEKKARLGKGSILYPHCYIGPECGVGEACVFFPRVTLYEWVQVGHRVRIHAGAILGADGFGYVPRGQGASVHGHQKVYHIGRVVIEDDVEIGANTCIDRGTFGETRIGKHAKLDNQVHVGHNARLDEGAILCGSTALAGHAHVGAYAYIGGLAGVANHVSVGMGARVGALTLVTKDVPPGGTAVGNPQRNYRAHFQAHALLNQLLSRRKGSHD